MLEYRYLYAAVAEGKPVKTTPADGKLSDLLQLTYSEGGPRPLQDGHGRAEAVARGERAQWHANTMMIQMKDLITTTPPTPPHS